jgi:hypothetical protein
MENDSGYRRTWRLRSLMEEYLVVRGAELRSGEEEHRISAEVIPLRLRGWKEDFAAERTLLSLYEALGGRVRSGLSRLEWSAFLDEVGTEVVEAFQTERLVLLKAPRPLFILPQKAESKEDDWKDAPEPTSWVGLLLQDEEGEPVPSQRVRIKLADGTVREGMSDDKGRIRLDGIPLGNCQVEFPGVDASDWRAA